MHLDFALPVDGDLEAGIRRHDQQSELSVMDYSYHVPITEWNEKVRHDRIKYIVSMQCLTEICHAILDHCTATIQSTTRDL